MTSSDQCCIKLHYFEELKYHCLIIVYFVCNRKSADVPATRFNRKSTHIFNLTSQQIYFCQEECVVIFDNKCFLAASDIGDSFMNSFMFL